MKYFALAMMAAVSVVLVLGDDDLHDLSEEAFCNLPKDKKTSLWDCLKQKVPKPVLEGWSKCAKDIYGVNTPFEASEKMCMDKDEEKHKLMEKCCEDSKKELPEGDLEKMLKDCLK